jgi:hypothetical protein
MPACKTPDVFPLGLHKLLRRRPAEPMQRMRQARQPLFLLEDFK